MIEFKVNIDYGRPAEAEEKVSNQELTLDYITTAISTLYPKGMSGSKRRSFGRIQRKLQKAADDSDECIELDEADFEFLHKSFNNEKATLPAHVSMFANVLEDYIDELKDSLKKKDKEEKPKEDTPTEESTDK